MLTTQGIDFFSPTLQEILLGLGVSLFCSFVVSLVYRYTYRGPGYTQGYVTSLVVLSLITTLVIMVIGNNLARAFGLVGALSIIRFRTALKDTIDIVYIFFVLAIGMAAGMGYHRLAVTGTAAIGLVLVVAAKAKFPLFRGDQFLLQMRYHDAAAPGVQKVMDLHCSAFDLINVRSAGQEALKEVSYYVTLKRNRDHLTFLNDLRRSGDLLDINLFRDEERV